MTTLLIATRNAHKVREVSQILGPDFRCLSLRDFPEAPDAVEDANTFAGNAKKKALTLAQWLALNRAALARTIPPEGLLYIIADDSGLEVDALNGAPGVHSARFAATGPGNAPDATNNAKLLKLLEGRPARERAARFRCVLAVLRLDFTKPISPAEIVLFDGMCEGVISVAASGAGGFGYDPLFVPTGHTQSFAELGDDVKNEISHRARALAKLSQFITQKAAGRSPAA